MPTVVSIKIYSSSEVFDLFALWKHQEEQETASHWHLRTNTGLYASLKYFIIICCKLHYC